MKIKLENEDGKVIETDEESCYTPDEDGMILTAMGGFSYFRGKKTDKPVTHVPLCHPSLLWRGLEVKIEDAKRLEGADDETLNNYFMNED